MFKLLFLLSSVKSATQARPTHLACAFQEGDPLEIRVYISSSPHFTKFNDTDALVWHEVGLKYSLHELERTKTIDVQVTPHLYANGSFFAHMFITKANFSPDPRAAAFNRMATTWITKPLVAYDKRLEPIGLKKLLTNEPAPWEQELRRGAADAAAAGRPEAEYISYWKPSFLAQLVIDTEPHERGQMPPLYEQYLHGYRLMSGNRYVPLIYNNELTSMRQHWKALNSTLRTVPLELSYRPLPLRRFQWMVNLENSFKMNEENLGLTEKDSEDMRGMFVNTNPYLLYTTVVVSAVHLLFDMLAFKNDLSFWSSVDTMEGLSSRSLLLNEAMEVIILLYLIEEDSSWLIKITSIFTLVLGVFKIFKSFSVKQKDAERSKGGVSTTDQYDRLAFKFLLPPLMLLVIGYGIYCLVTCYFRTWYSWLLETLVALVYGCGFIVMTPQLFINYRMKSVAHLPWKFFMYKALNTFIDDLFAFIIKMPTLHRMSCFRDDIVFAVFLYQRWVYKVDHARMNEFGQRGVEDSPAAAPKKMPKAKDTAADKKKK